MEKALGKGSVAENLQEDISKMTKPNLRAKCDELGIEYEESNTNRELKELISEKLESNPESEETAEITEKGSDEDETKGTTATKKVIKKDDEPKVRRVVPQNILTTGNKIAADADKDARIGQLDRNIKHNGVFYYKGTPEKDLPEELKKFVIVREED
jgi:hypothetical protein